MQRLLAIISLSLTALVGVSHGFIPVFEGPCGFLDTELTDESPHLILGTVGVYECYFTPTPQARRQMP